LKKITLLSHVFTEFTDPSSVNREAAVELTKEAHEYRKKVIVAGLFVEREIEAIIGFYLFPGPDVTEQQSFVAGEILGSDAVTFHHKRRLILSLVNQKGWLQGEAKKDFEQGLKRVISLRNAFAHGNIIVRDATVFLEYFEGARRKAELDDSFWSEVESSFANVVKHIEAIKTSAGMAKDSAGL
jgi:hypothetical protein